MSLAQALQPVHSGQRQIKLLPGGYHATGEDVALVTVLGSCVAACLHDPVARVGGMNHFMLPDGVEDAATPARYGVYAMEVLVNALLGMGAARHRLQAKVFGGGAVMRSFTSVDVGERNASFVEHFLKIEGIAILGADLRGPHPRKVCFHPATGRAFCRRLPLAEREQLAGYETMHSSRVAQETVSSGTVELFV